MTKIKYFLLLSFLFVFCPIKMAFAYTVVAEEQGSFTYKADEGKSYSDIGRYKIYFEVDEKNKIIKRTQIVSLIDDLEFGLVKGDILMAENQSLKDHPESEEHSVTVYNIIEPSGPNNEGTEKVIQAIGQPTPKVAELLTIGKSYVMQSRSTGEYVVVISSKIVEP